MMRVLFRITLIITVFYTIELFPQIENAYTDSLKLKLKNFEYLEAIKFADSCLNTANDLRLETLAEIYLLRAISNYSLGNEAESRVDFINILKIKLDFKPDPLFTSPKIVSFYENVRNEYLLLKNDTELQKDGKADSIKILALENSTLKQNLSKSKATLKSIILPGWGQRQMDSELKGWALTAAAVISLSASIYFIIDTNKKENKYLNEIESSQIQSSYSSYNKAYQLRNFSICISAATWFINLVDILFLSD